MSYSDTINIDNKKVMEISIDGISVPLHTALPRIEASNGCIRIANFETVENAFGALSYLEYGNHILVLPPMQFKRMLAAQYFLYYCLNSTSFAQLEFPVLIYGMYMFGQCRNCKEFPREFPCLEYAKEMYLNTPLAQVVCLSYPMLRDGLNMFLNSGLKTDQINEILDSLPVRTNNPVITFTGCPGAPDCDPSIATAKGWTVQI